MVKSVALVAMPVSSPHHPSLGLSLLKSSLHTIGIQSDVFNFYLDYVDYLGVEVYETIADEALYRALVGEWVFTGALYGSKSNSGLNYLREVLQAEYPERATMPMLMRLLKVRSQAEGFIQKCLDSVSWESYPIIGFTSSFQQNIASLALAKRIKERFPSNIVVFGGANCDGELGSAMLANYSFIDAVFAGEAENSFPAFVEDVLGLNRSRRVAIRMSGARTVRRWPEPIFGQQQVQLDDLPDADFEDFYLQRRKFPAIEANYQAVPLFETSRGCWWGAKHHCTFCGLNGSSMAYRSKSQTRALEEIERIAKAHGGEMLVVDNILDFKYFDGFIPGLAASSTPFLLHYETKVNLNEKRIRALAVAGVRKIQPGIESLNTRVLKLMDKGCTLLQNVQTLKLAAENGIYVEWGFLYGFPGETTNDYALMSKIVPLLSHLQPPAGITRVRADRFSPYQRRPENYGITIKPLCSYQYIYDVDPSAIAELAYHFDILSDELLNVEDYVGETLEAIQSWSNLRLKKLLYMERLGQSVTVTDARSEHTTVRRLDNISALLLWSCVEITPISSLSKRLGAPESEVTSAVDELVGLHLLLVEDGAAISLPLRQPGYKRALENIEIRESLGKCFASLAPSASSKGASL